MKPSLRLMTPEDRTFVHSSWHTSYWKLWAESKVKRTIYSTSQDKRIKRILDKQIPTFIAFFHEAPSEILGWACVEGDTLHYIYVKAAYRKHGIGTVLMKSIGSTQYSHLTDSHGRRFLSKHNLTYNPYTLEQL